MCYDGNMDQETYIEPGLLPVFRLLTAIRLGLIGLTTLEFVTDNAFNVVAERPWLVGSSFLDGVVLLVYLSWPGLQKRLKRFYLPVAIVIAAAGPVLVQYWMRSQIELPWLRDVVYTWQLLPVLLIALVIIAWQYNFRTVLVFTLGTFVLEVGLYWSLKLPIALPPELMLLDREKHGLLSEFIEKANPIYIMFMPLIGALMNRTVTFLSVGFIVTRLMHTQREQKAALRHANLQLTHYATTLEQLAVSRERNRLARELHDTLAHALSALAVQLGAVDALWDDETDEARALLEHSLEMTRTGLTETRRALHDLRASPLDDLGLGLALKTLADSVAARHSLEVDVCASKHVDDLSYLMEQGIYRVAQEALENVARHAGARHVTVLLDCEDDGSVTLTISDDGQGFDLSEADTDQHLGLRGMRERAEMMGGVLTVKSALGEGTVVTLSVSAQELP